MSERNMKPKMRLREKDGVFLVWAEDMSQPKEERYKGPEAEVYIDGHWLYVSTDTYEGTAMINKEALPALRRALAKLARMTSTPPADGV